MIPAYGTAHKHRPAAERLAVRSPRVRLLLCPAILIENVSDVKMAIAQRKED